MDTSAEEKQKIKDKIDKLKASKFKQQNLPAWRPKPTAMNTMITFLVFATILIGVGVWLFILSG